MILFLLKNLKHYLMDFLILDKIFLFNLTNMETNFHNNLFHKKKQTFNDIKYFL